VSDSRLLVPVSASGTLRQTVEYAVQAAVEAETAPAIRFAYLHSTTRSPEDSGDEEAEDLLDRVAVWAREDAGERDLTVETAHLGAEQYVFSPADAAGLLVEEARSHDIQRVVLDPEYDPGIGAPLVRPLEGELRAFESISVETAPVTAKTRRAPLLDRTSLGEVGVLFAVSFGFYQLLAGNFTWVTAGPADWAAEIHWLDIVTGTISASIVAVGLSQVVLGREPSRQTLGKLLRGLVYVPYLLKEIIKANVLVAAVILDPRLPIEPRLTRVRPALWGGLPVTTLANSITLTPGTLTVRVRGRNLLVHTLVPAAREDLFDGGLERGVRFVFYGRAATRLPGLRERGEAELAGQQAESDTDRADGETGPSETGADVADETGPSETGSDVADETGPSETGSDVADETGGDGE
jgi:multicomponent Na+:H+ antiporter subunit E